MAKVTAGAGYKELKRAGNYIAPQINKGADRIAANARQQKELNATEKARQDTRLDEALKETAVDVEAFQTKVTGFQSRDDIARDYGMTARDRSMQYAEAAREAAANQDWKGHRSNIDKMNRIKGDFKNAMNDEKMLGELFGTYLKDFQEGDIDDDDWLDFLEATEGQNYEIGLDEDDNRVMTALVEDDEGNMKRVTKKMSDIRNGKDRPYESVKVSGKGGLVDDMLVGFGKRKYDTNTGNYITTEQVWDDKNEKAFDAKVRGLQASDRKMYSLLKQASNGEIKKKEGFTEGDKEMVKDYLYKQVRGQYDETSTEAVRTMTVEEKRQEAARARALQRRGQDLGVDKANNANEVAWARLALDDWKAKNKPKGGAVTKDEEKQAKVASLHEVAKKIAATDLNDDAVQSVLDETGLGFVIGTDWQLGAGVNNLLGGDYNEFDIGRIKDIDQKDVFKIVKGLAKKAGLELDDTDIREVLMKSKNPESVENTQTETKAKPTAAELIAKYTTPKN